MGEHGRPRNDIPSSSTDRRRRTAFDGTHIETVVRGVLKPTPLSWYVSEALVWEGAPRTAKEIAAMLDLPRDRVLRVLRGLYEAGAVHRVRVFRDVLWASTEPLRVQDL